MRHVHLLAAALSIFLALSTTACSGDSDTPTQTTKSEQKASKKAKKGKRGKKAKRKAAKAAKQRAATYTQAQKCASPCLFLAEHSFATVQDKLCTWCPGSKYDYCELDWPSSDVPECSTYEHLKNCVYAAHGYTFKKKRWSKTFSKTGWYTANPAYDKSMLSKVARKNIKRLNDIATGKEPGCMKY